MNDNETSTPPPLPKQEEFAPFRGSATGVVARAEGLRGRNSLFEAREAGRQVEGLFESVLSEVFG